MYSFSFHNQVSNGLDVFEQSARFVDSRRMIVAQMVMIAHIYCHLVYITRKCDILQILDFF